MSHCLVNFLSISFPPSLSWSRLFNQLIKFPKKKIWNAGSSRHSSQNYLSDSEIKNWILMLGSAMKPATTTTTLLFSILMTFLVFHFDTISCSIEFHFQIHSPTFEHSFSFSFNWLNKSSFLYFFPALERIEI